jgi:NAD(P)-dependent dehydrogenase (short-subunit alcohol dehydrogenase family)
MTDTNQRDNFGLSGKVAIVTGGGAADDGVGNGRAAAILLARAGTKVSSWIAIGPREPLR